MEGSDCMLLEVCSQQICKKTGENKEVEKGLGENMGTVIAKGNMMGGYNLAIADKERQTHSCEIDAYPRK